MVLKVRDREVGFPRRPLVMGIVNINDDSFSGDGVLDVDDALTLTRQHIENGADIIDIGAESARTNREAIPAAQELARLQPLLEAFPGCTASAPTTVPGQLNPPLLSVNSWRPEVVAEVLPMGVDLLNDIGTLPDDRNARLCAEHGSALLIMHSVGLPKQPQRGRRYADVIAEVDAFFSERIEVALAAGLEREQLVLDPGLDFAKQRADNLRLLREVAAFAHHGRPILLPISRKTVIGEVLNIERAAARDAGTIAAAVAGQLGGAAILRVHHTAAAVAALRVIEAVEASASGPDF